MPTAPISSQPSIVTKLELPSSAGISSAPSSFRDVLEASIAAVDQQQNEAQTAVTQFLNGENIELHSVALAGQRADLSLDLFLQVRNKVISAYQEIMKMQL